MVANFGMSEAFGAVHDEHESAPLLGQRIATESGISDATVHAIETETRLILRRALEAAESLIRSHRAEFDKLVQALFEKETLERDELVRPVRPSKRTTRRLNLRCSAHSQRRRRRC